MHFPYGCELQSPYYAGIFCLWEYQFDAACKFPASHYAAESRAQMLPHDFCFSVVALPCQNMSERNVPQPPLVSGSGRSGSVVGSVKKGFAERDGSGHSRQLWRLRPSPPQADRRATTSSSKDLAYLQPACRRGTNCDGSKQ